MPNQVNFMDIPIWLQSKQDFVNMLRKTMSDENSGLKKLYTLNPEIMMLAHRNQTYKEVLRDASYNVVDGTGLAIALKKAGNLVPSRICGADLIYDLAQICQELKRPFLILGGSPEARELAQNNLSKKYPGLEVVGISPTRMGPHSFKEDAQITELLKNTRPAVVAVCLGAPRQESWIVQNAKLLSDCGVKVASGLGGSVDFVAGTIVRAPLFFRKIGMEWLWRLLREPSRIKRQLNTIPAFVWYGIVLKGRQ